MLLDSEPAEPAPACQLDASRTASQWMSAAAAEPKPMQWVMFNVGLSQVLSLKLFQMCPGFVVKIYPAHYYVLRLEHFVH